MRETANGADLHETLCEHSLQASDLLASIQKTAVSIVLKDPRPVPGANAAGWVPQEPTGQRGEERTSSTLSAPSIAFRTRSFSSLGSRLPALPASLSAGSTPGSNVLVPVADETSEGAAAADPDAAASRNEVCRAVGSPVAVRKSELACSRSWRVHACLGVSFAVAVRLRRNEGPTLRWTRSKSSERSFLQLKMIQSL